MSQTVLKSAANIYKHVNREGGDQVMETEDINYQSENAVKMQRMLPQNISCHGRPYNQPSNNLHLGEKKV